MGNLTDSTTKTHGTTTYVTAEEPAMIPAPYIPFQLDGEDERREHGRVLVASGKRSRNRDYWSGLPYRLLPSGMRFEHWNNLVLWMHNFNVPLATADLFIENGQLFAWDSFKFHRKEIPVIDGWIGMTIGVFDTGVIADLWEEKVLNSVSVHIMLTKEDEENVVETEEELLFPTSEVIEFSIVTVPGDREAGREEDFQIELVDRMVHKGVRKDIAQSFVQNQSGLSVPKGLSDNQNVTLAAYSGSKVYRSVSVPNGGKKMADFEALDGHPNQVEPAAADVTESEPLEVIEAVDEQPEEPVIEQVLEVEEETEIVIPVLDLVREIVQDQEALHILATALADYAKQNGYAQFLPVQEAPTKIKFVGGKDGGRPFQAPPPQAMQVQQSVEPTRVKPASAPKQTLGAEEKRPQYSILHTVHN